MKLPSTAAKENNILITFPSSCVCQFWTLENAEKYKYTNKETNRKGGNQPAFEIDVALLLLLEWSVGPTIQEGYQRGSVCSTKQKTSAEFNIQCSPVLLCLVFQITE